MTDINPTFSVYNLTLRRPSSGIKSVIGNFLGSRKTQEIVRCTHSTLELWQFDKSSNKFSRIHVQDSFCNMRSIEVYKTPEFPKDAIIITSDSGTLSVVEFDIKSSKFTQIINETYYKTGVRRLCPGEYVVVDSKGRAAMIGAIEKNKMVYTMMRDSILNRLVVTSPIEANRNNFLTYCLISLDVGYNNPIFAAIETDYSSSKQVKMINYYEFDLGLNHVLLKDTETIQDSCNHLISIPGGLEGPSGLILCMEGGIQYKYPSMPTHYVPLPARKNNNDIKSIIVASTVHKMKNSFFILLQNQFGDLFNVTLEYATTQQTKYDVIGKDVGPGMVTNITVRYFDTIPVCTSILILKSGYMYADCEHGDQYIYQFEKLGRGENEKVWVSQDYPDLQAIFEEEKLALEFEVKPFDNISLVAINESLNPLMEMKLPLSNEIATLPELYAATGTGARSALKILHKTISLSEIVTQELPSQIMNAFTTKIHRNDEFDKLIILSFFDGSIILKIGEEVEEAENSGFLDTVPTLNVHQIGSNTIVQVYAIGLKQIFYSKSDEPIKSVDWSPPAGIEILFSACTNTQVLLALSNGDVVYFECSPETDALSEHQSRKEFNFSITSIAIGDIPSNRIRAPYGIVTCKDASIHVISLDPKNLLTTVHTDKLSMMASSALITTFKNYSVKNEADQEVNKGVELISTHVHIGLRNGFYARYELTEDGVLENLKTKFIMPSQLNISPMKVTNNKGESTTLAILNSIRSFIIVPDQNDKINLIPLPIPEKIVEIDDEDEDDNEENTKFSKTYTCTVSIHSEDVPQGIILAHGEKLTIASISPFSYVDEKNSGNIQSCILKQLELMDNIESVPLRYTPRFMVSSTEYKMNYIACSDHNIDSFFQRKNNIENDEFVTYGNIEDIEASKFENVQNFGYPVGTGYGSCIHVFSLDNSAIGQTIELLNNETTVRLGLATLEHNGEISDHLFVSTIQNLNPSLGSKNRVCFVRVYSIEEDGSLKFVYKQQFNSPILAIHEFQGRVVLGFGDEVGIYELGKLQMLRKSGIKLNNYDITQIVDIKSSGFRLFISDIRASVCMLTYSNSKNEFKFCVNDSINRHVTRSLILDHDTIFIGDKFGNLTVLRCPETDINIEHNKFDVLMSFYIGEVITSLIKGKIGLNGEEVVVYAGINGSIGAVSAMKSVKEVNFFRELERLMKKVMQGMSIGEFEEHDYNIDKESMIMVDRNILKYRSYYVPKRSCIDGDVVEQFFRVDKKVKQKISKIMERSVEHIENRIMEMRNRLDY